MLDLLLGFPSRCWTPRLLGLLARALVCSWTLAALPGPAWGLLAAPSPLGLLPRPCRALGLAELAALPSLLFWHPSRAPMPSWASLLAGLLSSPACLSIHLDQTSPL